MVNFFKKKSGLCTGACVVMLGFGALMAHRVDRPAAVPVLATAHGRAPAPLPRWRDEIDLALARGDGTQLVQTLADGSRLRMTLDPDLQQRTIEYLRDYEVPYGAAVLYRIDTGEVLVMAGHSQRSPDVSLEKLCLTPWAPAASVFKIVTAGALLSLGVPPSAEVCYHGGTRKLTGAHLRDIPRLDRTCHNLSDAVARSLNPVIAKLAVRHLGWETLRGWADRFGFNRAVPFDVHTMPSRASIPKDPLELARTAAGFWHTEISALHGAVIAAVAASGGLLRWPHVVRSVELTDGSDQTPLRAASERVLPRAAAHALAQMMARTVSRGTARRGFYSRRGVRLLPEATVAGKTGSLSRRDPHLSYSWFVGFAPADHPEVAFSVLLGNPPRWRIKASTAARVLLHRYFARHKRLRACASSSKHATNC